MERFEERFRKGKIPLFKGDEEILSNLYEEVGKVNHKTLILWNFLLIKEPVAYLTGRYSNSYIFDKAIDVSWQWAVGNTTRSDAGHVIHSLIMASDEVDDIADKCLFYALREAFLTIGDKKHAAGFALYDLSSLVYEEGPVAGLGKVPSRIMLYQEKLEAAISNEKSHIGPWAPFLSKESGSLA